MPVVVISPPISVVPPVFVVRLLAVTVLLNLLIPVLLTAKSPNAWVFPTLPIKLTLPVPESTVRLLFPSTVPLNIISPAPVPVSRVILFSNTTFLVRVIFWLLVVISAFRFVVFASSVIDALSVPVILSLTAILPLGDLIVVGSLNSTELLMTMLPVPSLRPMVIEAKPSVKLAISALVKFNVPSILLPRVIFWFILADWIIKLPFPVVVLGNSISFAVNTTLLLPAVKFPLKAIFPLSDFNSWLLFVPVNVTPSP